MEKKNEQISAVDTNKLALGRALMHIVYTHCADAEDQNIRACVDELMAYFAEAERRKEREVLEEMRNFLAHDVTWEQANGRDFHEGAMLYSKKVLHHINSRLAELEGK